MLKKLLILLLFSCPVLAQYSPADLDLAETTYLRKFSPEIINKYLTSGRPEGVRAALLSLSNSTDTTFVQTIRGLSFSKYGDYICFALGHIGYSKASTEYLLQKALNRSPFQESAFDALGRIGDKESFNYLIDRYLEEEGKNFHGISLAIAGFNSRGIKTEGGKELAILTGEVSDEELPLRRRALAAFALSRTAPARDSEESLLNVLSEKGSKEDNIVLRQYVLSALRKLKSFKGNFNMFKSLVLDPDWRIRTEAAKVLCYYNFRNEEELNFYLRLLKDGNPNVSRQAAISLREMPLSGALREYLKKGLEKSFESSYTLNTTGEIFLTLAKLEPGNAFNLAQKEKDKVGKVYYFRMMQENFTDPERNLSRLIGNSSDDKSEELERLNALLALQKYLPGNEKLDGILLSNLASGFPAALSITADGLDSLFIERHKEELKRIIKRQAGLHMDDAQFTESNMSLVGLAGKISPEFRTEVLNLVKTATLYSMSSYAFKELGKTTEPKKDMGNFIGFWKEAFKYKYAVVTTDKGSFTIKFNSEVSPISVGSFCSLAKKDFFSGIVFHRVVPDFVIQAGDPEGTGWGGPGYEIVSEFSPVPFERSYVGMASAGKDTEGSQWFVMHSYFPHLNGRYSNFGKVVEGMDVVDRVDQGDKIIKVELK
ncbi:MAG: peptidylprolyl isomerase [Acidobacteriota bacterium]